MRERYYVVEGTPGYPIGPAARPGGKPMAEVLVLDRDCCSGLVWSSETTLVPKVYKNGLARVTTMYQWPIERKREYANDLASRLNAEAAQATERAEAS